MRPPSKRGRHLIEYYARRLFSGTAAGTQPSNSLCIAQAALIVSTKSPLLSFTTFAFVLYVRTCPLLASSTNRPELQLWILVSARDPDRPLTTSPNIALVIFPYFFWTFLVVGSLAVRTRDDRERQQLIFVQLAIQKQTNVGRSTFYCTLNDTDRIL